MKVSSGIFLVGIVLTFILGMMVFSDLGNSDHLMYGLISEDVSDKIITLYFFIIILKFFFGGIVYFFEKGMNQNPLEIYQEMSSKPSKVKKRSTRSNPTL